MKERDLTEDLMKAIKRLLRGAVIIKHSDRATVGVPDLSVSLLGATCWIEVKHLRKGQALKDIVKHVQVVFNHELFTASNGRAWFVIYQEEPKRILIMSPHDLARHVWPSIVHGHPREPAEIHPETVTAPADQANIASVLRSRGVITSSGWNHRFPARLVQDAVRLA